jgi:hypothetical protein
VASQWTEYSTTKIARDAKDETSHRRRPDWTARLRRARGRVGAAGAGTRDGRGRDSSARGRARGTRRRARGCRRGGGGGRLRRFLRRSARDGAASPRFRRERGGCARGGRSPEGAEARRVREAAARDRRS